MNGQAVWMDDARNSLSVQMATSPGAPKRTLEYRRDGALLMFVDQPAAAAEANTVLPEKG